MTKQPLPTWDLSDLYTDLNDAAIEADMKKAEKLASSFAKKFKGHISSSIRISPSDLRTALKKYEAIVEIPRKLGAYAYLQYSTHATDQTYGAFLQKIQTWATTIYSTMLFFELELKDLPLEKLVQDPKLKNYKHFLELQAKFKPHRLSEQQEELMQMKSLTGRDAFIRLRDQEATAKHFEVKVGKKSRTLNETETLHLLHSAKPEERKAAAEAVHTVYKQEGRLNAFIYNMLIQDLAITNRYRKFESPDDGRHLENETDGKAVDALVEAVTENYSLVHDYYGFKKKILGVKKLYEYDRYAPIAKSTKKFSYEEAKDIVLSSFREFSPLFADTAQLFFDNNWIDVPPYKGKQGGAYCYYVTPSTHPYVLLNFQGSLNDVSTLAHELGHAVHAYLARRNTMLNFDWPLTTSETASVFAEMLVFQHLKQMLPEKERLALYMSKVENIFAAVFRQIGMYKFEKRAHEMHAAKGELPVEVFNKLWRESQEEMFGNAVTVSKFEDTYWNLIPHVIHTPFYVYSYAYGELLTLSLYAMHEKGDGNFVKNYINLLQSGGSKTPQELLQPFGVDTHKKEFWLKGINEIKTLIDEAEKLYRA